MKPILKFKGINSILNSSDGPVYVLSDISFQINRGKIIGLVGESGSGKTQLSMAAVGMQNLTPGVVGGAVTVNKDGDEISIYPKEGNESNNIFQDSDNNFFRKNQGTFNRKVMKNTQILKRDFFGWIPQEPKNYLNPFWKLKRLFQESYNLRKKNDDDFEFSDLKSFAQHYLDEVDLKSKDALEKFPHELSGGECQRAMIAFVLSKKPDFLIADETTTGLDVSRQKKIINLFKKIKSHHKDLTIILISHDFGFLDHLVDHYMVMYGGFLVEHISDKSMIKNPTSLHPYTRDLLNRLWNKDDQLSDFHDELSSRVDLHGKLTGCPYMDLCSIINKGEKEYSKKCKTELPPIVSSKNAEDIIDLTHSWRRCWRDLYE